MRETVRQEQQVKKCIMICKKSELLDALIFLNRAIPKTTKATSYNCEITVKTNEIDIVVIGASRIIYCNATGPGKISLPFLYFKDIVKQVKTQNITIEVDEGLMTIGNLTVEVETCFFHDDSILRSINLPINYSVSDLLKMKTHYTPEELRFNKIDVMINKIFEKIDKDIDKIAVPLKKYGITRNDIETFVYEKMNLHSNKPSSHEQ